MPFFHTTHSTKVNYTLTKVNFTYCARKHTILGPRRREGGNFGGVTPSPMGGVGSGPCPQQFFRILGHIYKIAFSMNFLRYMQLYESANCMMK